MEHVTRGGRTRTWKLQAFLFLSFAVSGFASQDERVSEARRLLFEIERAARLPAAAQSSSLAHLYREICSRWDQPSLFAPLAWTGFSTAPEPNESVEDLVKRLEQRGSWPWLAEAGRRRCHELMMAHREEVATLVREDLTSDSQQRRRWGLSVAGALKLNVLYDEVVSAFRGSEPDVAAYTLRDLDDPRAVPVLIQSSPDQPTKHFEILRGLQRDRPAHVLLLELARSNDSTVRWQAAYAMAESRDSALAPVVERLAKDPVAAVRRQAGQMGALFHEADYRGVHSTIVGLLSDPDIAVRSDVALAMAWRQDRACATALLELVRQEELIESWRQSNIVQAIHTLTGSYFGLTPGTPSSKGVRDKALVEFAEWIKKQGAP